MELIVNFCWFLFIIIYKIYYLFIFDNSTYKEGKTKLNHISQLHSFIS